jgi:hypothetical protein
MTKNGIGIAGTCLRASKLTVVGHSLSLVKSLPAIRSATSPLVGYGGEPMKSPST